MYNDPNAEFVTIENGFCSIYCNGSQIIWTGYTYEDLLSESIDGVQLCDTNRYKSLQILLTKVTFIIFPLSRPDAMPDQFAKLK